LAYVRLVMRRTLIFAGAVALAFLPVSLVRASDVPHVVASDPVTAGRFLVAYGGCNDCHTDGWDEHHEAVPVARRLTGSARGFTGPWGTSYPANLRLLFAKLTQEQWLALVRNPHGVDHPPMPWYNVQQLTVDDQRALYVYIHGLGAAGSPAPRYAPPAH
jgi:hypothetical protein